MGGGWSLSVFVVGRLVAVRALRPGDVAACLLTVLARLVVLPVLVDLVVLVVLVVLVLLVVLVVLAVLAVLAVPLMHVVVRCFRLSLPLLLH